MIGYHIEVGVLAHPMYFVSLPACISVRSMPTIGNLLAGFFSAPWRKRCTPSLPGSEQCDNRLMSWCNGTRGLDWCTAAKVSVSVQKQSSVIGDEYGKRDISFIDIEPQLCAAIKVTFVVLRRVSYFHSVGAVRFMSLSSAGLHTMHDQVPYTHEEHGLLWCMSRYK